MCCTCIDESFQPRESGYVALASESIDRRAPSTSSQRSRLVPQVDTVYHTQHDGVLVVHPDRSYSYAYGPQGLPGLLHNYFALGCAIFASIGGLLFGYDQGVIANVLVMRDFVERWPVSAWEKGLMSKYRSRTSRDVDTYMHMY